MHWLNFDKFSLLRSYANLLKYEATLNNSEANLVQRAKLTISKSYLAIMGFQFREENNA
jgi:hypothetical protein